MYLQVGILDVNRAWPLPPNQFALLLWRKKSKKLHRTVGGFFTFLAYNELQTLQTALSEESKSPWWLEGIYFTLAIKLHNV